MLNILLLTHDFGFPEGYAATLRARLVSRALTDAGARVQVYCLRYSEIPPDLLNTQASGVYQGIPFRYMNGSTTRPASFAGRRTADVRSVTSTMRSILAMRRAGTLDAVYLWSTALHWNPMSQTLLSFLNAARIPVVLELNERPWNQGSHPGAIEKRLSPLRGISGAIVISDYLEKWAAEEARYLGRDIGVIRVPILVDTDEVSQAPALSPRERPFVVFACPPGRTELFRFVAEAMRTVWREGIASDLVITGASFQKEQNPWTAEMAADPGVAQAPGSIDWLGTVSRDTLLGLYRQASALLLPLADELNSRARFPTKLGEYLSSGTPVVASARGELLAYLKDGESVFLAGEGGAETFGRRIADVYRDPAAAAEVGENGREVAVAAFDYRRFGAELYRWFREVITR
jgi:glycosyltransferase involved in cell wall biosynthesis